MRLTVHRMEPAYLCGTKDLAQATWKGKKGNGLKIKIILKKTLSKGMLYNIYLLSLILLEKC